MSVLVCGGAGYIGSHVVLELIRKNYNVVVVDNLSNGHRNLVSSDAKFYCADIRDEKSVSNIIKNEKVDAVMDFAAFSLVGESIINPARYYDNNVVATFSLLNTLHKLGIDKFVFSSTAAVYGEPETIPITEENKINPINTYGQTKIAVEKMLHWFDVAYGMKYIALRYFNVAGADESGSIGELHNPETHLIPIVLNSIRQHKKVKVFGDDYPTKDGTCIRDYIHVSDLAQAHILALENLYEVHESKTFNLGNNNGISVFDIIHSAEDITGYKMDYEVAERRLGDPAVLIASSDKIKKELGWKPKFVSAQKIIETAWIWHKKLS